MNCKKRIKNLGNDSFHKGFYLCHLDEERLYTFQNGLPFCQRQMSVKSCIGMIECVLQQQAVQRVGVGKSKVRETLKAERVLLQTPLCVCF